MYFLVPPKSLTLATPLALFPGAHRYTNEGLPVNYSAVAALDSAAATALGGPGAML